MVINDTQSETLIRDVPDCVVCCTVGIFTRRPLYLLKDVENRPVAQAEGHAQFGLSLQNVSCPLAVKRVDLFNDSMEVVSAGVVHRNACPHSVMTAKRVYSYWFLENTPRFKKIYTACDILARTLCVVYAVAGAGSNWRTLHLPSVL